VYLEIFCTTKTSVDNPLLAPSGHGGRKTFLVIDEGYLDNQEGYWVEDEEDGTEGFLEADDDAFWVYDEDNYTWFQRRFQGKKGKGKGKFGKHDGKDGKGGSKDGAANLADTAQGSAAIAAAVTFYTSNTDFNDLSFMATENHEAFITQPLTPTSMVLDLGCTRAMTSRVAAQDLMKFCDQNKDCGIWYNIAESQSKFTFANSVAPSSHLVLDLIDLSEYMWHVRFGKFKKSSFLTYYMHYEYGFHQKLSGGSSFEEVPEEPEGLVFATDDEWVVDENKMELIRVHKKTRQVKYAPKEGQTPIPLEFLDVKRTTIMEFSKEKIAAPPPVPEDDPDLHEYAPSEPGEPLSEEARNELFPDRKDVRDVSSLEPRRIALPLPGHEVSRASPQYKRMLEKLNDEVELYKLHVKHYHMSPAQFCRRTSMLGLPGEIYDKYDRIFRTCRVCSTS
ncbi:unnamed protein product, partial [Symbiodinium microadriaticum]